MPKRARRGDVRRPLRVVAPMRVKGEGELHGARSGTLVYHYVDAVVLHGGIKVFLHHGTEPVDFVDEENVVFLKRGENAGQVAGFVEHGAGCHLETDAEFVGDDGGEGGFSQAGRAVEQEMVKGLVAQPGCGHEYLEILHNLVLPRE